MKKIFLLLAICLCILGGCNKSEEVQKWEYKVIEIGRPDLDYYSEDNEWRKFNPVRIENPTDELNALGKEGWELVATYTSVSTAFPNFGNHEYVTGLQSNTRTHKVCFVFKRPLVEKKESAKGSKNGDNSIVVDTDVVCADTAEMVSDDETFIDSCAVDSSAIRG